MRHLALALTACSLTACQPGNQAIGDDAAETFSAIGENETVRFLGNEPFWGGEVSGTALKYTTPENPEGIVIETARRAGLGGISWSGQLGNDTLMLAVSELGCSDGMSDRIYPFTATLQLGSQDVRQGCAWTKSKPFTGPKNP